VDETTMATKKKPPSDDTPTPSQIGVRLSPEEYQRLERLAVQIPVSTLARIAIRLGLDVIEAQPGVLLGEEPKTRPKR